MHDKDVEIKNENELLQNQKKTYDDLQSKIEFKKKNNE